MTEVAEGGGSAYDVRAKITELNERPEVVALDAERMKLGQELHEQERQVEGSRAHAVHVAQLRRLHAEAVEAFERAKAAQLKADEHAAGKRDAVREAAAYLDSAELALNEAVGSAE